MLTAIMLSHFRYWHDNARFGNGTENGIGVLDWETGELLLACDRPDEARKVLPEDEEPPA